MSYADLGEVLSLAGKPDEAAAALEQALGRYERKGNLVMAGRARARIEELPDAAPADTAQLVPAPRVDHDPGSPPASSGDGAGG